MSIRYGSRVIGDVRAVSVHGYAGLGTSQLRFSVNWNIYPKVDERFTVFGTSIWVSGRAEGESQWLMVGPAMPETAWSGECKPGEPFEQPLLYRLTLPDSQLLAIEEARKGQGMSFQLEVRGHVEGPDGICSLDSTMMLAVNTSDWVRVLKEANAAEVLLVGVQLPAAGANGKCRAAIDLVRKANEHLVQGHYDAAVAQCRLAFESLWKVAQLQSRASGAFKRLANASDRQSMSKVDRELALGEALRVFAHQAHHVGADAEPEVFGRLDAAFAVAATAALVSSLAAAPERFVAPASETKETLTAPAVIDGVVRDERKEGTGALSVQVVRVRANLAASHPRTMKSLRTAVHSWLGKKLTPQQLDGLMVELQKQKVFVELGGKPTYPDPKK